MEKKLSGPIFRDAPRVLGGASSVRRGGSRARQLSQILVDRTQLFVVHSSHRTPGHLWAERTTVGIGAGAHGGDEFLPTPLLHEIQVGPYRTHLAFHAAVQASAVAFAAILIRHDVLAVRHGGALWRRLD